MDQRQEPSPAPSIANNATANDQAHLLRYKRPEGHKKILVNLGEVSYLDSSAIGELFSGYTLVANYGGQLNSWA